MLYVESNQRFPFLRALHFVLNKIERNLSSFQVVVQLMTELSDQIWISHFLDRTKNLACLNNTNQTSNRLNSNSLESLLKRFSNSFFGFVDVDIWVELRPNNDILRAFCCSNLDVYYSIRFDFLFSFFYYSIFKYYLLLFLNPSKWMNGIQAHLVCFMCFVIIWSNKNYNYFAYCKFNTWMHCVVTFASSSSFH